MCEEDKKTFLKIIVDEFQGFDFISRSTTHLFLSLWIERVQTSFGLFLGSLSNDVGKEKS